MVLGVDADATDAGIPAVRQTSAAAAAAAAAAEAKSTWEGSRHRLKYMRHAIQHESLLLERVIERGEGFSLLTRGKAFSSGQHSPKS